MAGGRGEESQGLLLSIAQEAKDGATSGHAAARAGRYLSAGRRGVEKSTAGSRGAGELADCEAAGNQRQTRLRWSGTWVPACSLLLVCCPLPKQCCPPPSNG